MPVLEALPTSEPERAERPERKAAPSLPRFQVTATDQLTRRGSDSLARLRANLRNAFTPSQPVMNPSMFAGRAGVLTSMIRSLEDQRLHLVIYGDRGIGKTSLLHMLTDAARDARYIVIYMSCGAGSTFDETFRAAGADIPLLFHSGYAPTASEAEHGSTLADIFPSGRLSPRQFGDVCVRITGTRVLIILDEFDRCESAQFRRDLAEVIKILSDRSLRVQLVIAGVAADLADLVEHIPSIRRNILAIKVPLMNDQEVHELLANGERASGLGFTADARAQITTVANGSPYISSLVAHHAGLIALDAKSTTVRAEDVAAAVSQSLDDLWLRIPTVVQGHILSTLEHAGEALTTLAKASLSASGPFAAREIETAATSPENANTSKRIADKLVETGVLLTSEDDRHGPRYKFIDDGVSSYLWFRACQQAASSATLDEQERRVRKS